MDKPNIVHPPPGWERLLRIRKGGTKFVDVYYDSPSGMRFRSQKAVEKYLKQHPEYEAQGVKPNMFSFKTATPLQEDYVKKHHPAPSHDINDVYDVDPISWVPPNGGTGFLGGLVSSAPSDAAQLHVTDGNSLKKPRLVGEIDAVIK